MTAQANQVAYQQSAPQSSLQSEYIRPILFPDMRGSVGKYRKDKNGVQLYRVFYAYLGDTKTAERDSDGSYLYTRDGATAVLNQIQREIRTGTHDPEQWKGMRHSRLAIGAAVSDYLNHKKEQIDSPAGKSIKQTHYEEIKRFFDNHFEPILKTFNVKKVTDIKGYILDDLYKKLPPKWRAKTRKNTIGYLSNFFGFLERKNYITKRPTLPEITGDQAPAILHMEGDMQIKSLDAVPDKHELVFTHLMVFGERPSETIGHNIRDVDLKKQVLTVQGVWVKGKYYPFVKNRKPRYLHIPTAMIPLLRRAIGNRIDQCAPLFINPNTHKRYTYTCVRDNWNKIRGIVGTKLTLTDSTRNSVARAAFEAGEKPEDIAEKLGHDVDVLHRHYLQIKAEDSKNIFDQQTKILKLRQRDKKKHSTKTAQQ